MIDLHTHSTCSDGIYSPIELLEKAEEEKLKYFSITDHDEVSAYRDLFSINTKKYFSGTIILGSEIRFVYKGTQMEMLCYGYDYEKLKDNYWVNKESYHEIKKAILDNLLKKGKSIGLIYDEVEYCKNLKPERSFYAELQEHEENRKILQKYGINHSGDFFRKLIANPKSPLYFDSTKYSLSFDDVTSLIHEAGGIAVLAHPFGVYNIENPKEIINELISTGKLDGLECMHANINEKQTEYLFDLCKKHNLVSTGGSDFHGYPKQVFARANEGTLKMPSALVKKFLERLNPKGIIK